MDNTNNNSTQTISTTGVWPGAFKIYNQSRAAVMLNINTIIACFGITFGISILSAIFDSMSDRSMSSLIGTLVGMIITPILVTAYLNGVRGRKVSLKDCYDYISSNLLNIVLTQIVVSALVVMSLFCFVIPFFIVMPRLMLAVYYAIDRRMDVGDAIRTSWNESGHHFGKIWGLLGVNLLIGLICLTIIGIPFAFYFGVMYSAATAILYIYIDGQKYKSINA
jgi:uncharacterized membrane protein